MLLMVIEYQFRELVVIILFPNNIIIFKPLAFHILTVSGDALIKNLSLIAHTILIQVINTHHFEVLIYPQDLIYYQDPLDPIQWHL